MITIKLKVRHQGERVNIGIWTRQYSVPAFQAQLNLATSEWELLRQLLLAGRETKRVLEEYPQILEGLKAQLPTDGICEHCGADLTWDDEACDLDCPTSEIMSALRELESLKYSWHDESLVVEEE